LLHFRFSRININILLLPGKAKTRSLPALITVLFFCFAKRKVPKEKATFFQRLRRKKGALRCYITRYAAVWRWFLPPIAIGAYIYQARCVLLAFVHQAIVLCHIYGKKRRHQMLSGISTINGAKI
jgi:hypothetical protein